MQSFYFFICRKPRMPKESLIERCGIVYEIYRSHLFCNYIVIEIYGIGDMKFHRPYNINYRNARKCKIWYAV